MTQLTAILFLMATAFSASTQAAQEFQLNPINTNNCVRAHQAISQLDSPSVRVFANCLEYQYKGYKSSNGKYYNYRMLTSVKTDRDLQRGDSVAFAAIPTNDCEWMVKELHILNNSAVRVQAHCSPYIYQGYPAADGFNYNYEVYSTMTVLY